MKFTANTKPIVDGLDLCIINANVSKFYQKSCIVELTIENNRLRINTEASSIKSELCVTGKVSGEGENHIFVDSLLFKQLLKTIETDVVDIEIKDDGLVVYSGKSKFNLPQVISGDDLELDRPTQLSDISNSGDINVNDWEFIKDQQLYALAMSFTNPVYTNVWLGDGDDVLASDFDNSLFTHSNKSGLNSKCLISDTIVNLLTNVPENSKITSIEKNYEVFVETDPYTYLCEFTPKYEEDEGVGDYSSEILLGLFNHDGEGTEVNVDNISKYITQAELFSSNADSTINLSVKDNIFSLNNDSVNCKVDVKASEEFECLFKLSLLKDAFTHMDSNTVKVNPIIQDGEVSGIIIWTDNMSTVLGGVDVD